MEATATSLSKCAPEVAESQPIALVTSTYRANAKTARSNFHQNPGSRWYKKDAPPDQTDGGFAFQRLRQPFFTPIITPGFKLTHEDKLFAIGSCFARGIENALISRKMSVLSAAPEFASFKTVREEEGPLGFTNKYNTHSIYNELSWALDPEMHCPRDSIAALGDGLFVDPHVNPSLPLADEEETWRRRSLIQSVNRRVAQCRVVIITLGLIEVWHDTLTDMFLNSPPPLRALERYPDRYEFHVTDFSQNLANLEKIHALLESFGQPGLQIVVTVSPVPLMNTFSNEDVVLANSYSKSLLRTVAQQWATVHSNVHYFPSYEMVQNSDRTQTWAEDLRHVKGKMVKHITDFFLKMYLDHA